jgi:hypothetical protein
MQVCFRDCKASRKASKQPLRAITECLDVSYVFVYLIFTLVFEFCPAASKHCGLSPFLTSFCVMQNLKGSDVAALHSELLGFWTLSIARNSKYLESSISEIGYVSFFRCGEGDTYSIRSLTGPVIEVFLLLRDPAEQVSSSTPPPRRTETDPVSQIFL